MINILPEFESRQVLTSDELNWLTCYLDTQNRQTRRLLIGSGLIGGLQVRLNGNEVQISNGIGITSAGHIVQLFPQGADMVRYTKTRPYQLAVNQKWAYHYLPDMDVNADDYSGSTVGSELYFGVFRSPVLELMENAENGGTAISGAALQGKVVMLFAEIVQHELKNCEDDNCQERGKKYVFNTKALLVSKEDALAALQAEYGSPNGTEADISKLAFPWLHLPALEILKPAFSNPVKTSGYGELSIRAEYIRCMKDFLNVLGEKKDAMDMALDNLRLFCSMPRASTAVAAGLFNKISGLAVMSSDTEPTAFYQIFYDFLWTFVKAYKELQLEAQQLRARLVTRENAFPQHIFLGQLAPANDEFDWPQGHEVSVYRHAFHSRHAQTQQAEQVKKISLFLNRLVSCINSFDEGVLKLDRNLQVNNGGDIQGPLSGQSVPYYFSDAAFRYWSHLSYHPVLQGQVTAYQKINASQASSARWSYNSLPLAMQSGNSFFRIEGVYGKNASNALETIFQIRKTHGLAFEVLVLRINEKAPFNHITNSTINEDLESLYQVTRAELIKLIQLTLGYLGSLQVKFDKMQPTEDLLIRELGIGFLDSLRKFNVGILLNPIAEKLENAIKANDILNSVKSTMMNDDADVEFKELKTIAMKARMESGATMFNTIKPASGITKFFPGVNIRFPGLNFPVFWLNTLGALVDRLRGNQRFRASSDLSFYLRLMEVAKRLQGNNKQSLFMLVLHLYCALKVQEVLLDDEFTDLDIEKYQKHLDSELLPACDQVMNFVKSATTDPITSDDILLEVGKQDIREHAIRLRYDDDWVKVSQLVVESRKRNGGLGIENLLERFVQYHPGISHGCGVPKGGTYIMVYNESLTIAADFYLPYIIASNLRPLQFTFVERSTVTISGFVKRKDNGTPVAATLLVGTGTVVTDKDGFYSAIVNSDDDVAVICRAEGMKVINTTVKVEGKSVTKDFEMEAEALREFTVTAKFVDRSGKAIGKNIDLVNKLTNQDVLAREGTFKVKGKTGDEIPFAIKDEGIEPKEFMIKIGNADESRDITVVMKDFVSIKLISADANIPFNPALLRFVKAADPLIVLEAKDVLKGEYLSKNRVDVLEDVRIDIRYNDLDSFAVVKAGVLNDIEVPVGIQPTRLPAGVVISYDGHVDVRRLGRRGGARVEAVTINETLIRINARLNIGFEEIETKGPIVLGPEFRNPPALNTGNVRDIQACIFIIDGGLIVNKTNLASGRFELELVKALNEDQIRKLMSLKPAFEALKDRINFKKQNYYCFILPENEIVELSRFLV